MEILRLLITYIKEEANNTHELYVAEERSSAMFEQNFDIQASRIERYLQVNDGRHE